MSDMPEPNLEPKPEEHCFPMASGMVEQIECFNGNCLDENDNELKHPYSHQSKRHLGDVLSGRTNGEGDEFDVCYIEVDGEKRLVKSQKKCHSCKWWKQFKEK